MLNFIVKISHDFCQNALPVWFNSTVDNFHLCLMQENLLAEYRQTGIDVSYVCDSEKPEAKFQLDGNT